MHKRKILVWLGVGVFSGLLMSQAAFADSRFYGRGGEIRHERRELRNDGRELNRDRAELRSDLRHGAPASEIAGDRAEIRHDWQELGHDSLSCFCLSASDLLRRVFKVGEGLKSTRIFSPTVILFFVLGFTPSCALITLL